MSATTEPVLPFEVNARSSRAYCHFLSGVALTLAIAVTVFGFAQADDKIRGETQDGVTSGTMNTVTHNEPAAAKGHLTPGEMRAAKPLPMPSVDGPPIPQQMTPNPYTEPAGSSSPGYGGPPHR